MKVSSTVSSAHHTGFGLDQSQSRKSIFPENKQNVRRKAHRRPAPKRPLAEVRSLIGQLFSRYQDELLGYLLRMTDNPAIAEEVAQEAYLRLLRYARMPEKGRERSYLFTTATRAAMDALRVENRAGTAIPPEESQRNLPMQGSEGEPAAMVHQALRSLTPRCREVFLMHRILGWRQTEIAQILGLSLSMVEKHVARGARTMGEQLEQPASGRARGKSR